MKPQPDVIRSISKDLFDKKPYGIFTKEYESAAPVYSFPISDGKIINPRYNVGEVIYLKEPYQYAIVHEMMGYGYFYGCNNIADYSCDLSWFREISSDESSEWHERWNKYEDEKMNKLFMPESAARYFIKITGVRAELLQDISEEDCLKEGIKIGRCGNENHWMKAFYAPGDNQPYMTARSAYEELINRINGKDTWALNPYVWVYDFELTTSKI